MVLFTGGNSGGGSGSPSPLPPPPRLSSSTLSPLAPPFTLNPNANRLDSLPSPNSDYTFPFPHVGAAEGFRAYGNDSDLWQGKQVNSSTSKLHYGSECTNWSQTEIQGFVTDSYPCTNLEGPIFQTSGHRLVPHIQISEPVSVKKASNIFGADTTYKPSKEDVKAQYISSESSLRPPSSLHKGMPYAHTIPLESCKTVDSNPSYDNYMTQLGSCTIHPMAYYFSAKTCSTSFQPVASGTSSYMLKDKSFTFEDPYSINVDYVDHVPLKDNRIIQKFDTKEGSEVSEISNVKKYSLSYFSSGLESANRKSMVHSMEVNLGLKNNRVDLPNAFVSDSGLAEPVHSPTCGSSGTLDQTVDSPCWKGASASQQSPFVPSEPEMLHSVECGSKLCSELDKCQKHLPFSAGYSGGSSPSEQLRRMIYKEKMGVSGDNLIESSSVLSNTKHKCKDIAKTRLDCLKEIQHSGIFKEQNAEVRSDKEREPDGKDNEMVLLSQESIISSNQPILTANHETSYECAVEGRSSECQSPATEFATPNDTIEPLGSSLVMFKDASLNVFLGKLQYLSEMLLSSDSFDASELKDHDHEVLQSVIDNLEAFAIKNKKDFSKGRFCESELTAGQSKNINVYHEAKENMHSIGSGMNNNDLDSLGFNCGASYIHKDQDVTQELETIQEKKCCEQEEKLQSLVYKKLWVDAEAALCSMKYELQLAQMKTETANHNYQTEGNTPQSSLLSSPKFFHNVNDTVLNAKQSKSLMEPTVDKEVNPSVTARLNILKVQHDRPSSDEDVDRSVMARLEILKGRDDGPGSRTTEQQQKMTMQTDWFTEHNFHPFGGPEIITAPAKYTGADLGKSSSVFGTDTGRYVDPSTGSRQRFQ